MHNETITLDWYTRRRKMYGTPREYIANARLKCNLKSLTRRATVTYIERQALRDIIERATGQRVEWREIPAPREVAP